MGKVKYYLKRAFTTFNQMEMRVLPGNIAFFFVLALIPIITIVIVIASRFSISVDSVMSILESVFPEEVSSVVLDAISGKGFDYSLGTFNVIAIFAASNGTYAIVNASNTMYHIEKSDTLKDRLKSVVLLFILLMLIVFLLVVPMFGEKILSLFGSSSLVSELKSIYKLLRWPLTLFLIYFNLKLIYTIAPSKSVKSSTTTYGAIFTTVIWVIATAVFSYYLKYFAHYNVIYGSLSSIIILMMWLYIISYVFVMGMAINATNDDEN